MPYWTGVKSKIIRQLPHCYKDVPYQIKGDAVREAWQAVKNAKIKGKQTGNYQTLRFQKSPDANTIAVHLLLLKTAYIRASLAILNIPRNFPPSSIRNVRKANRDL